MMNRIERKKANRIQEASNVRFNRVITGYIETNYPEVYKEAKEFFEQLNALYPNKKDLRRTNQYMWMKNDFPQKKYYPRKSNPKKKEDKIRDNMELVIPLMRLSEKTNEDVDKSGDTQMETIIEQPLPTPPDNHQVAVTEPYPAISEEMIEEMISDLTKDPELEQFFNETIIEQPLPAMSEETIEEMISDLAKDPELEQFFNDIDFDDYDYETPLERELLTW